MRYLFPLIFILASCSPQYHIRRAERHLRLARELGAAFKSDTVKVYDTIFTAHIQVDSFFRDPIVFRDTIPGRPVTITKDRLVIRYQRIGDTVRITGEVKPDTVIVEKKIYVENETKANGFKWFHLLAAFLAGAGLMAIAAFFRR
jgi:hypothetical protein